MALEDLDASFPSVAECRGCPKGPVGLDLCCWLLRSVPRVGRRSELNWIAFLISDMGCDLPQLDLRSRFFRLDRLTRLDDCD